MTTSDWIVLGVGSYAAIVASAALIWNIVRELRRIVIQVEYMSWLDNGKTMFVVYIINKTRRVVNIKNVGFIFSDGLRFNLDTSSLKIPELIPGEDSCTFYLKIDDVKVPAKAFNKTFKFLCVEDGTGRLHKKRIPKWAMKILNN